MPLKAILFDLDDTLYDHQHSCRTALSALRQQYACFQHAPFDEFEHIHRELLEHYHMKTLQGLMSLDEARLERLRQLFAHYGERVAQAALEETARMYRQAYLSCERPVAGALALLERLRAENLHIAIVTNNTVAEQTSKLKRLKLDHLIDTLVISEEVGVPKPDPRIFTTALERVGCHVSEVVMVGDSWTADVLGAQSAGIRAVWLNRYALPCPDAEIATEITTLEPLDVIVNLFV